MLFARIERRTAVAAKATIFLDASFVRILSMSMSKGKPGEGSQPPSEPDHQTDSLTNAPTAEAPTMEAPTVDAPTVEARTAERPTIKAPTGALADAATILLSEDEETELFRLSAIGPYRILRKLGEGGMGAVYLAERDDAQYKKQVAVKLVKRGMANSFIVRRFRNERQILASLDHPNIGRLLDGGSTEEGLPYFVMEYIEGQPINEYADQQNLSTAERLKLFRKVCAAVHYAHQKLVVHRDIKPSNILVTPEGEPKLMDFGIAKLLDAERAEGLIDTAATAVGMMTPEYASPEQVRGEAITIATDIYSLGVVLYQLLTGRRPYQIKSLSPRDIVQAICEQEPLRPSTAVTREQEAASTEGDSPSNRQTRREGRARAVNPDKLRRRLRGDLDNIVLMAMRKEPERRYASVEQFSSDIERHLDGLPVIARRATFTYRAGKFLSRHKPSVVAALLILALLAGGLVAINRQRQRAEHRFDQVRRLANSFMFELHDRIEPLPGSTPVRELLVTRALEYLDSLAADAAGDASLQRELAQAYQKVGDVQGYPFEANLGDTAGALASYRKALAISEALVKDHPNDLAMRRDLLVSTERIGDVLQATGDTAGALEHQRRALAYGQTIAAADPNNNGYRRTVMIGYLKVGQLLAQTGDADAALEHFSQSLALAEKSAEADPSGKQARTDLALMHNKVADVLMSKNDLAGALDHYRTGLTIREALVTEDPNNAPARRAVAASNEKIASVYAEMGKFAEALASQRKTLASDEGLAAADPANIDAQFDLGIGYSGVAELLARSGDNKGALDHYRKGLAIFEKITTDNPDNAEMKSYLADSLIKAGKVYAATGDAARASESVTRGRVILEALSAEDAANVETRTALADAYLAMGDVEAKLAASNQSAERLRSARAWYQQSLAIYDDLRRRDLLPAARAEMLGEIAGKIADADAALTARGNMR
jgi:non-specific serine/threonine protein kinase/serine/threonine-protein kinase